MMNRRAVLFGVGFAILALALPSAAITVDDLDLAGFPEGAKVVDIAQNAEGIPLVLCVRPTRMRFIQLPGPPTIKWIKVPLKGHDSRYESDFAWVKIEIPNPDPGKTWTVEGMQCIRKCPQGASGTRCVDDPAYPCPVCVK